MIRFCLCVCPSVSVSVRVSPPKRAVTYEPLDGLALNFQGPLTSSEVIFGQVTWTPRLAGSGPDPEKAGFSQTYLLRGFWGKGVVSHLFRIGTTRQTKFWERNFEIWPTAGEKADGRQDWPGGNQNFGISTFFIKLGTRAFCFL